MARNGSLNKRDVIVMFSGLQYGAYICGSIFLGA